MIEGLPLAFIAILYLLIGAHKFIQIMCFHLCIENGIEKKVKNWLPSERKVALETYRLLNRLVFWHRLPLIGSALYCAWICHERQLGTDPYGWFWFLMNALISWAVLYITTCHQAERLDAEIHALLCGEERYLETMVVDLLDADPDFKREVTSFCQRNNVKVGVSSMPTTD